MAAFVKFECFTENLAKKEHNLHADTLKVYITNTAPNVATNTVKADHTEVSGNGATAGGTDTQNTVSRSGGVTSCVGVDFVLTGTGAGFGPFRYAVLYNDTHASDALVGYWDYGAAISVLVGETFTVDFGTEMFTIT